MTARDRLRSLIRSLREERGFYARSWGYNRERSTERLESLTRAIRLEFPRRNGTGAA
jgi:hypothetical protein